MKKSLIALAVAGAMTVPMVAQADATVYGEFVGVVSDSDAGDLNVTYDTLELGVKGTVANDIDGLETGFNILFENDSGDSATFQNDLRKAYAYMSGDFGMVAIGKQDNPADIIADTGLAGGEYTPQSGRIDQSVVYSTPDMGGFSAAFGFTGDGDDTTDSFASSHAMIGFEAAAFGVALSYEEEGDADTTALAGSYSADSLTVFASFWDKDDTTDTDGYSVGAEFAIDKTTLYAELDSMDDGTDDSRLVLVGASYALGSDAWVGVEYNEFNDYSGDADTLALYYGLAF